MVCQSCEIPVYAQHGSMDKIFYCTFSFLGHRPQVRCSNLANCRFTLVLLEYSITIVA